MKKTICFPFKSNSEVWRAVKQNGLKIRGRTIELVYADGKAYLKEIEDVISYEEAKNGVEMGKGQYLKLGKNNWIKATEEDEVISPLEFVQK